VSRDDKARDLTLAIIQKYSDSWHYTLPENAGLAWEQFSKVTS